MPQPGAPIATSFVYIEVLYSDLSQQTPDFSWFASQEPYRAIELFVKSKCILVSYCKDLSNGTRVYRFPNTAAPRFTEDTYNPGNYFALVGTKRYYLVDYDPSIGKAIKLDWRPV